MNRSSLAEVLVAEEVVSAPKRVIARIGLSGRAIRAGKVVTTSEARKAVVNAARAYSRKHSRA